MRRLFAAIIVVTVAFTLVGCGGGEEAPADAEPAAEVPEPPAQPAATTEDVEDTSPLVEGFPAAFPSDASVVPVDILERIDSGQPLFIYYFDKEHEVVDDLDAVIDDVTSEYRGLIHTIEYGLSEDIADVVEDGLSLGEDLSEEDRAELKKVYRLADELGIGATPFIILVDREGTIVWMHRGYVDQPTLELKVLLATQ